MLKIGLSRVRRCRSSLQDLAGGVSGFSRDPVARNHRRHFFDPNEVKMIAIGDRIEEYVFFRIRSGVWMVFDPVWSKQRGRKFPVSGCLEKRVTPPDRSWREIRHIMRRKISYLSGTKAHANVLKVFFCSCLQIRRHKKWPEDDIPSRFVSQAKDTRNNILWLWKNLVKTFRW